MVKRFKVNTKATWRYMYTHTRFSGGTVVKNPPANVGDTRDSVLISGSGQSPGEGNGNPLQYSCLENSMERGAWWATVRGVAKSQTQLSAHIYMYIYTCITLRITLLSRMYMLWIEANIRRGRKAVGSKILLWQGVHWHYLNFFKCNFKDTVYLIPCFFKFCP